MRLCNPHSEMGAQSWPHCLVSQGLRGPGEVLGLLFAAEQSETLMQARVHGDRQSPDLVTAGLVTLCEIYVWNSSEGLGCTIPPKCRDANPRQNWTSNAKDVCVIVQKKIYQLQLSLLISFIHYCSSTQFLLDCITNARNVEFDYIHCS